MRAQELLDFLHTIEKMKCHTRHCWTSDGRHESVAEHSYRLATMAFLLKDEFPDIDMDKVLRMCLVHDWGEAVTGDIPSFLKTGADEKVEDEAVAGLTAGLPDLEAALNALFAELTELKTPEARLYKALDKTEAVIQHNEAPLDTWLPEEKSLNLTYGEAECDEFPFAAELRRLVRCETEKKLGKNPSKAVV